MTIAVIDYGMGNLRSVAKALRHVAPGAKTVVTSDAAVVRAAERVVLPGQAAMPDCMRCIDASGLREVVLEVARDRPFLGICLGLQMLFDVSEEGPTPCLGVMAGRVERFYFAHSYHPVPADRSVVAGTTDYPAPFTCAVARANIFATQFHPEKSHRAGLQLLANFVAWNGRA